MVAHHRAVTSHETREKGEPLSTHPGSGLASARPSGEPPGRQVAEYEPLEGDHGLRTQRARDSFGAQTAGRDGKGIGPEMRPVMAMNYPERLPALVWPCAAIRGGV